MKENKYKILVSPGDKPRRWILEKSVHYRDIWVPIGFTFDGASIPLGLRWLLPHGGKKFFAACLHDWLYRHEIGTREGADKIFLKAMLDNGVSKRDAYEMYWGVRLFGGLSWGRRKKKVVTL